MKKLTPKQKVRQLRVVYKKIDEQVDKFNMRYFIKLLYELREKCIDLEEDVRILYNDSDRRIKKYKK